MENTLSIQQQSHVEDTDSQSNNLRSGEHLSSGRTPYQALAEWKLMREATMKGCLVASPSELRRCLTASEIANLP